MKTVGLVCEFNPFHNGHRYLLTQLRTQGAEAIVCCMSGNFTQRGEPALISKTLRARAVLQNGADLVIELPVVFACAGAERFAFGGAAHLNALGVCDTLAFGSESAGAEDLLKAAQAVTDESLKEPLQACLSQGMTFAAAREQAVRERFGEETARLLREPNHILGVEYCKALQTLKSPIKPHAVRRQGVSHDSQQTRDGYASASALRKMLQNGEDVSPYVPENTLALLYSHPLFGKQQQERLRLMLLYRLKSMTLGELSALPHMSEGLENRLFRSIRQGQTVEEILSLVKCKRYPLARLRRCLLHAFLHLNHDDFCTKPQYLHILGFSHRGQTLLRQMKSTASLPVLQRRADRKGLSPAAKHLLSLEDTADTLYQLPFTTQP